MMLKGADVADRPPSVMLAVTVSVPEVKLPGWSVRPLLTSAAVSVTVEALKLLPSGILGVPSRFIRGEGHADIADLERSMIGLLPGVAEDGMAGKNAQ